MKRMVFLSLFLVAGSVRGGGEDCDAAAALALSAAANGVHGSDDHAFHGRNADPLDQSEPGTKHKPVKHKTLAAARKAALTQNRPLIVWKGRAICPGCIAGDHEGEFIHFVGKKSTLPNTPVNSLVVFAPKNGQLVRVAVKTTWKKGHLPTVRETLKNWRAKRMGKRAMGMMGASPGGGRSSPATRPAVRMSSNRPPAVFRMAPRMSMMRGGGGGGRC